MPKELWGTKSSQVQLKTTYVPVQLPMGMILLFGNTNLVKFDFTNLWLFCPCFLTKFQIGISLNQTASELPALTGITELTEADGEMLLHFRFTELSLSPFLSGIRSMFEHCRHLILQNQNSKFYLKTVKTHLRMLQGEDRKSNLYIVQEKKCYSRHTLWFVLVFPPVYLVLRSACIYSVFILTTGRLPQCELYNSHYVG